MSTDLPEHAANVILLVEDQPLIARNTQVALQREGFQVITAHSGERAIELSRNSNRIDLILMDIDLGPGIDGTRAAEMILSEQDVPVVFLSSYTDSATVAQTEEITSYGYVVKSAGEAVLLASVRMAFRLRESHARLRENEHRYATLFDTITQGVIHQAHDGSIISANPAAEQILGLSFDQMRGRTSMDPRWRMIRENGSAVAGEEHPAMLALKTGSTVGPVVRGVFHPGRDCYVWLRITAVPVFELHDPTPVQVYATFEDITEEREISNRYQDLVDHLPGIVYTFSDRRGGIYHSNQTHQILGYDPVELKADPFLWNRSIHPDDREAVQAVIAGPLADVGNGVEYRVQTKDGRWIRVYDRIIRKTLNDGEVIIDGFATDITEQRRVEGEIRQLAAERERLVQEIQHRIKNNLNTMTSLISLQIQTLEDPRAAEALEDTRNRLHSLGMLYDHLYHTDSSSEGSIQHYLIHLVSHEVQLFPYGERVQIHTDFHDYMCTTKMLSSVGLIVNELVTNAMKYAFPGHPNPTLSISGSHRDDHYQLTIADNGPGFPAGDAGRSSSGFGMLMINALTEQLGGTIRFETDGGTRVTLKFPIAERRPAGC